MQELRRRVGSITVRSGEVEPPREGTGAGPFQIPPSVVESAAMVVATSSPIVVISGPEQKVSGALREANLRLRGRADQRLPDTQAREHKSKTGDR